MTELLARYGGLLWGGLLDTLYMVVFSTLFSYVLGLPFGVLLSVTKKGGIASAPAFHSAFGWAMNILRSLPFIILIIFIMPFTRFVVGTTIGATAAIVALVVGSSPFVARMVETTLEEVDSGTIEAARCMGATNLQIIFRVLLPESVPSLLRGLSISTITILGYTAIAGVIGAGGLGDIAVRYGHHHYQTEVMYATVVLLVLLVCLIQAIFGLLARLLDKRNR